MVVRKNIYYKFVIITLSVLVLCMLYLGNYNLIEGNSSNTQQEMGEKLLKASNKASTNQSTLENNSPVTVLDTIDCNKLNETNKLNVNSEGGTGSMAASTLANSAQLQMNIASSNNACSNTK